jgi:hypothetical protein
MVEKVRSSTNPAGVARAAILPLEDRALFSAEEVREVASFLYLMKRRDKPSDAEFVAEQLLNLLRFIEPASVDLEI